MNRFISLLPLFFSILFPFLVSAQELKVKSMEIMPNDLSARTNPRADGEGNLCALLKIFVMDDITEVQGNGVGDVVDKGVEKWIYLPDHTKQIQLNFRNHFPLMITFDDYNFHTVSERMTYVLKLVDENDNTPISSSEPTQTPSPSVVTTPDHSSLYDDLLPTDTCSTSAAAPSVEEIQILAEGKKAFDSKKYLRALEIFMTIEDVSEAQDYIGDIYYFGYGVDKDLQKGVEWYRKSAEQGSMYSQRALGHHYFYISDHQNGYPVALKWFELAAGQGDSESQYNLGVMYEEGKGVEKNLLEAVKWYKKAAAQGDRDAKKKLKELRY